MAVAGASFAAAAIGLLIALGAGVGLAAWRARDQQRLATWLHNLELSRPASAPEMGPPLAGLVRPLLDIERIVHEQRRQMGAQRELLDQLFDALPDPVLLVDRRRRVLRANPAAERSFGADLQGLDLGRAVRDPAVLSALAAAIDARTSSNVAFSPISARHKRWATRIDPVQLVDGTAGVLMTFREQSEQVMIERMRSDFVANASHEIRTPLAAIHGLIETLRGPARDDPAARESFLEIMGQETARMTRLVDDLLSLSRIELAANQPPTAPCDLGAVLATVVERLQPIATRHRVDLVLMLPSDLPEVRGDADQLHQLFSNLIDNAINYGGEGKPVRIEVLALPTGPCGAGAVSGRPCIQVTVIDQGDGIAREHIPRLTERFYRVDKARSRGQGGTGLGLAIVKHIVRRHQGHLAIESELARGSQFRVYLPALA